MNFGDALKATREEAGMLQADLAKKADLDPSYISQLEKNRKSPTLTTYFRICNVLGVSPSALMKRIEEISTPAPNESKPSSRRTRR